MNIERYNRRGPRRNGTVLPGGWTKERTGRAVAYLIRREGRLLERKMSLKPLVRSHYASRPFEKESFLTNIQSSFFLISQKFYLVNCAIRQMGSVAEVGDRCHLRYDRLNVKALAVITQLTGIPFMDKGSHIIELCSSSAFLSAPFFDC